jgi:hypothetical protein
VPNGVVGARAHEVRIERVEFKLNVVGVTKSDERTTDFILDT